MDHLQNKQSMMMVDVDGGGVTQIPVITKRDNDDLNDCNGREMRWVFE